MIVQSWRYIGIGHSILSTARWMQLLLNAAPDRSIRFAFCVPHVMRRHFGRKYPLCENSHFDLHRYMAFDGMKNMRATLSDLNGSRGASFIELSAPQCRQMLTALRGSAEHLLMREPHAVHLARCTSTESDGGCVAAMQLLPPNAGRAPPRLASCDIGLHLRTLGLDSRRCNLLTSEGRSRCPKRFHRALRSCTTTSTSGVRQAMVFPRWHGRIEGCAHGNGTAALFATSDARNIYERTRALGWSDLNESAAQTWAMDGETPLLVEPTLLAWASLARCRKAIIAPVPSAFSDTAALAANVPLLGCCTALR